MLAHAPPAPRAWAWLVAVLVVPWVLAIVSPAAAHPPESESFAPPPVTFKVIAPSAKGPWLLRIDNTGDEPVRIAADVRLLSFHVRAPSAPKTPLRLTHKSGWQRRATTCNGPSSFGISGHFPAGRELVLEPGHSYVEQFDPRLICFDDDAKLLVPGAMVKPYYGWKPNKRPWMKMSVAPFVADASRVPRRFKPLRRLEAPTMVLSHAPPVRYGPQEKRATDSDKKSAEAAKKKGRRKRDGETKTGEGRAKSTRGGDAKKAPPEAAPKNAEKREGVPRSAEEASRYRPRVPRPKRPPPPKDELAAALTLTTDHYADARRPSEIVVNIQAHNVGQRPIFVALRSRMLSFTVAGPDGVVKCPRTSVNHKVPRDLYRTLQHDKHIHMVVLLAEMCPPGTFERPGLYAAVPTLHADASGEEYGLEALTGVVTVRDPGDPSGTHTAGDDVILVRKRRGPLPFYQRPPTALPTRVLPE